MSDHTRPRRSAWSDPTAGTASDGEWDGERFEKTPLERVYFALDVEACQVKIGRTSCVKRRLKQLSLQRGRKLDLLGSLDGGYALEQAMHQRFANYRREGREWFSTEILGELAPLLAA